MSYGMNGRHKRVRIDNYGGWYTVSGDNPWDSRSAFSQEEVLGILHDYRNVGIEPVIVLSGFPPSQKPHPLVTGLREGGYKV